MMKRITLDMDDVLADTEGKLIDFALREFTPHRSRHDYRQQPMHQLLHAQQLKNVDVYIHQPGFFVDIPVMEGAQDVVAQLTKYYEIFVATAAMEFPNSFREKYDWLQKYFPFIPWTNYVFCGHKSIISTDYLIDDRVNNLLACKGKPILFSAPHNLKETDFQRVSNWTEIADLFLPVL